MSISHRRPAHIVLGLLVLASACHGSDRIDRNELLQQADATRLVGVWDVTVVLERPLTQLYDSMVTARQVRGTMAFTENRSSDVRSPDFGIVTDKGVYDLDLSSFNLPMGADDRVQSAVARTAPMHAEGAIAGQTQGRDSVTIALEPGDSRLTVRLTGVLVGDSIAGSWTAEFLRTQATGRFSMQRRHPAP
jgi:hypothetical protein